MSVLHVSFADAFGGAGRAAYRIHRALVDAGYDSSMRVMRHGTDDDRTTGGAPHHGLGSRIQRKALRTLWTRRSRGWATANASMCSFGYLGAGLVDELNSSAAQVLHLHWVQDDMLSVRDIGRLEKPIVWTLHDMWAFCGGEHYDPNDGPGARFRRGYDVAGRPAGETAPDLNRLTWEAKRRHWAGKKFTIVSPSRWLAECAAGSSLLAGCAVHVIPNALDTDGVWKPVPRDVARAALGLPVDKRLVLMGAEGGTTDPRKGGDLLRAMMDRVAARSSAGSGPSSGIELVVYGQSAPTRMEHWPCPVHWLGNIRDDRVLALAYSAADATVVPSRQDNLPNGAVEAQACGTPVLAFDIGGLPDIVTHQVTGWLAKPFDVDGLADGLLWLLAQEDRRLSLSQEAREQAITRYAPAGIAARYAAVYDEALEVSASGAWVPRSLS